MGALEPIEYLRQVRLFSRLSDADLRRVAAIAQEVEFPRHSHLFEAGQPGRAFYYIVSGEAVVRAVGPHGRLRPVAYLRPGEYLGVTSLLLGEPHDATVEATTDVVALVIERQGFRRLQQENPSLDEDLLLPEEVLTKLEHEPLPWLRPDEVIVFLERRHWFVFARALFLPTLAFLLFNLLFFAGLRPAGASVWSVPLVVLLLVYLPAVIWLLVDWRNDYFIVTTQRVAHHELVVLQYESRHEAPLDRIQDVTVTRNFWGQLIGFGNVVIQTAAHIGIGPIVFDHLPDPEEAKNVIFQQIYRAQAQSQAEAEEGMRAELKRRLGWATPEELAAQGEARVAGAGIGPVQRGRGEWLSRLPRLAILPPVRLEEGSRITWRKHHLFLLRRIAVPLLASFVWFLLFANYVSGTLTFLPPRNPGVILGLLAGALPLAFWLWWQVVDWENDVYILSDDRIIDVEKRPLFFSEERREATLDRIQDVTLTIPGPLAAALGYGDVDIQTAGGEGQFTFTRVAGPHEVQREIMSRLATYRERRQQLEREQRRREVGEWFAIFEELRRERGAPRPGGSPPAQASEDS